MEQVLLFMCRGIYSMLSLEQVASLGKLGGGSKNAPKFRFQGKKLIYILVVSIFCENRGMCSMRSRGMDAPVHVTRLVQVESTGSI